MELKWLNIQTKLEVKNKSGRIKYSFERKRSKIIRKIILSSKTWFSSRMGLKWKNKNILLKEKYLKNLKNYFVIQNVMDKDGAGGCAGKGFLLEVTRFITLSLVGFTCCYIDDKLVQIFILFLFSFSFSFLSFVHIEQKSSDENMEWIGSWLVPGKSLGVRILFVGSGMFLTLSSFVFYLFAPRFSFPQKKTEWVCLLEKEVLFIIRYMLCCGVVLTKWKMCRQEVSLFPKDVAFHNWHVSQELTFSHNWHVSQELTFSHSSIQSLNTSIGSVSAAKNVSSRKRTKTGGRTNDLWLFERRHHRLGIPDLKDFSHGRWVKKW